jgi:anti-sigma regulatory factor (Ser/Thr protein kinase)
MNLVLYAYEGDVTLRISEEKVELFFKDKGPGIPDIELAMQEGYSTATPQMREMGFGAGMGLPNIKKTSDELKISSEVNKGTNLEIVFNLKK